MLKGHRGKLKDHRFNRRAVLCTAMWLGVLALVITAPVRAQVDPWKSLGIIRLPGELAPDFTLPSLDGESITLSDLRGRIVFINFWTTWCPPCKQEMASLERLYRKFKDRGFTILAVDIMEGSETVEKFVRKNGLSFPILLDTKGEVSERYMATAIPSTFIVDKDGKIIGKLFGAREWDGEHAEALLGELLGG